MVIDFHTYIQPTAFLDRLRKRNGYPRIERVAGGEAILSSAGMIRPVRPEQNDIDGRISAMTAAGINIQILRLQHVNGVDAFDGLEGLEIAQAANDELAEIARKFSNRFIPFAAIPMRDPAAAERELERAITQLGHRGAGISTSCNGRSLDSPEFECIFATAARLRIPVFLLPNHPSVLGHAIRPFDWLDGAFGFQVDLSVAALRLLCGGIFSRYPDLQIVIANLGGVFPFVTQRLDHFWERMHAGVRPLPIRPSLALRRYYLTTSSAHQFGIQLAAQIIGADRLVFGSDYPSFDFSSSIETVRSCGLLSSEIDLVLGGNAAKLLALKRQGYESGSEDEMLNR